jgi:Protein of unknown function (DUF559)
MNGFGTERARPLPPGFMSAGWADGNLGENRIVRLLRSNGITPAFNESAPAIDCYQQYRVGPYSLDFAWPKLKIALEADGSVHRFVKTIVHDRERDAWLRDEGWLVFRVDTGTKKGSAVQLHRVLAVVRALAHVGS